jgi:hypothetical protein
MLQFEPRFNVFVLALASRQKIQSRVSILGNITRVSLHSHHNNYPAQDHVEHE